MAKNGKKEEKKNTKEEKKNTERSVDENEKNDDVSSDKNDESDVKTRSVINKVDGPTLGKLHFTESFAGLAAMVFAVIVIAWTRNYVLQIGALALGLLGLRVLGERIRPVLKYPFPLGEIYSVNAGLDWNKVLKESAGPLVLIGLTLVLYHPLLQGFMPLSGDHTVHQYKAYITAEHMIPSGRLMGWSMFSGAGYPAGQLYPILGELWVSLIRYATFKSLSWEATYAIAFLGVLLFLHLAPYYIGRKLYGPVAGLLFGLFVMTDMGGFREGGFIFTIYYGVWPLAVGVTFSLLALERLINLKDGLKGMVSYSLMVMFALLSHPISLIFLFIAVPVYAFYMHFRHNKPGLWFKGFAGAALGAGLAAFWFLPYLMLASDFSASVSNLWKPLPEAARAFVSGGFYEGAWPWALVTGTLGLIAWVADRRPAGVFLAALAAILVTAASLTVYGGTGVENWLGPIRHMQFQRFVIFIKMLLFLAGGALVQRLFIGIGPGKDGEESPPLLRMPKSRPVRETDETLSGLLKLRLRQAVPCLVLAPLTIPLLMALWSERFAPVSDIQTRKTRAGSTEDLERLLKEIEVREKARGTDDSNSSGKRPFFRVAYWTDFNDHSLAAGPVMSGLPQVKCSFIPSETFKYLANPSPSQVPRTAKDFEVLNVKYIIAVKRLPYTMIDSPPLARSGPLTLYEFPGYRGEHATLLGPGTVETVRFSDEEIRLRVSGVEPGTPLVLHTAHFANWRAMQGGKRLKISPYDELAPNVPGLMKVQVSDGEVVFSYSRGMLGVFSKLITFLSLLLCASIVLVRRKNVRALAGWKKLETIERKYHRKLVVAGTVLLLSIPVLFLIKWMRSPEIPKDGRSLTWDLDRAEVYIRHDDGSRKRCRFFVDGRFLCGTKSYQYVGPVSEEWGLKNRRGLWAHPHPGGVLVIEYPDTLIGEGLSLEWGLLQSSAGGAGVVQMQVLIDDHRLTNIKHSNTGWSGPRVLPTEKWKGKKKTVRFEISAGDISARHFAFDARILP